MYCINNLLANSPRYYFDIKRLCQQFVSMYKKRMVNGIFLSNAIYKNSDFSQEEILKAVLLLRKKFRFRGYIHAKILPGTSPDLIKYILKYVDRASINLELPTQKHLSQVSDKDLLNDLLQRLIMLSIFNKKYKLKAGITTQFIVGIGEETDREILKMTQYLYRRLGLTRVYYSGFIPFPQTGMRNRAPADLNRIRALYQADFLIKDYGINYWELPYTEKGFLPTHKEIKFLFAKKNRHKFPVNINKATLSELILVPGIGKKTAEKILKLRQEKRYLNIHDFKKLRIPVKSQKWICV